MTNIVAPPHGPRSKGIATTTLKPILGMPEGPDISLSNKENDHAYL
jgi:hypothetical protein